MKNLELSVIYRPTRSRPKFQGYRSEYRRELIGVGSKDINRAGGWLASTLESAITSFNVQKHLEPRMRNYFSQ